MSLTPQVDSIKKEYVAQHNHLEKRKCLCISERWSKSVSFDYFSCHVKKWIMHTASSSLQGFKTETD
jgi:hypothetical protein